MLRNIFKMIQRKLTRTRILNNITAKEIKGEWENVREYDQESYNGNSFDPIAKILSSELTDKVQKLEFIYKGVTVGFGSKPPYWCGKNLTWSFSSVSKLTLELIVDLELCSVDKLAPYLTHSYRYIRELAKTRISDDT